ncbi:prohibitin family protein [Thermostichus vulcanus]|uniref:Prohibitin family protein n=1 Tax=Thermostichus vulcanus str. 'Rupite' TaxID=2813851 RepID=A0ABT0C7R5_THEVL|nr:prohibitin family protein [Thermostichus vulcanus]MCJ2541796.1 prohibitin family protein [Thermostichus vulcanus str. 'Rupite']
MPRTEETEWRQTGWLMAGGIGLLVALGLGRSCLYVTPPGHATVVFNTFSGLQKGRVERPGVIFVVPGIDTPITYTVLTRVWEFTDNPASVNSISNGITVNTADGQAFAIDVAIALKPNPDTLDELHANIGENYLSTVVVPVVRSKIRDISASFDSEDFYRKSQRTAIEQQALALIQQEMPHIERDGQTLSLLQVEGVFLGNPDFPEALKDSIERKQVASISAQTAAVRAQIQEKETERLLILAAANQRAIELKGQAAAQNAQLADLLFYETLQERIQNPTGAAPPLRIIRVEGDSTLFLNVDPHQAALQRAQ